jgi:hypothetical protein
MFLSTPLDTAAFDILLTILQHTFIVKYSFEILSLMNSWATHEHKYYIFLSSLFVLLYKRDHMTTQSFV